jgi:FMN-dependent NADH-azoreductase
LILAKSSHIRLLDHQKTMIILSARGGHDFDSADAPFPIMLNPQ